jgi:hypothetical protein
MAPPQNVVFSLLQGAVDCRLPEYVFPPNIKRDANSSFVAKPMFSVQLHLLPEGLKTRQK